MLDPTFATSVRRFIYVWWIEHGAPPTARDVAQTFRRDVTEIEDVFLTFADERTIVLAPGTRSIWMAHPFSAIPTTYQVTCGPYSFWATCAWDALGIAGMLGQDTDCEPLCADCDESLNLSLRHGKVCDDAVVHFAVPPRDFWKDIGYT